MNLSGKLLSEGIPRLQEQLEIMAFDIANTGMIKAREKCPVRSGKLRDSHRVERIAGDGINFAVICGGQDAPYAPYVVGGTEKMAANDFFEQGRQASIARAREMIGNAGYGKW